MSACIMWSCVVQAEGVPGAGDEDRGTERHHPGPPISSATPGPGTQPPHQSIAVVIRTFPHFIHGYFSFYAVFFLSYA